jgi:xanthine dehydrogenase accessory factor
MRKLFRLLKQCLTEGKDVVLVTVVASSGSTPRGAGARMLISSEGRLYGTIGGGNVEYVSEKMAMEVLEKKASRIKYFKLTPNQVADLGMICGGDVTVYFQYIPAGDQYTIDLADKVETLFKDREVSWIITDITQDKGSIMAVYGSKSGVYGMEEPKSELKKLFTGHPVNTDIEGRELYVEQLVQAGKVYVFGGGHVAQELVPVLSKVGFCCIVMDDREAFANRDLFPNAEQVLLIDFNRITDYVTIGEDDYVAVMTRGHKYDTVVQDQVLYTPACYIGVMGSSHKKKAVFEKLVEMGHSINDMNRITSPIGLNIKAETPAEIAISIAGQMIEKRAERNSL